MIERYLGNRNAIVNVIINLINNYVKPGELVADTFSGSLTVSVALRNSGYRVIANDINLFSYYLATAYLTNNSVPNINIEDVLGKSNSIIFLEKANEEIKSYLGNPGYTSLHDEEIFDKTVILYGVLLYLEIADGSDLPIEYHNNYFYDTYTPDGKSSYFISKRGTKGFRKFFTPVNGKKIDLIMNYLRYWSQHEKLSLQSFSLILSSVLRSIEKISNTQGTYHDFPRNKYDPRALKNIRIELPIIDILVNGRIDNIIGKEYDLLDFIKQVPEHKLLYLDPPYNFRQYTSYYFMLNLLSRYHEIDDLHEYFSNIRYVRGQNMEYDFTSSFSKKSQFIPSLKNLIENAKTKYVLLSYFNGKNHWGDFKGQENGDGYNNMMSLLELKFFKKEV